MTDSIDIHASAALAEAHPERLRPPAPGLLHALSERLNAD